MVVLNKGIDQKRHSGDRSIVMLLKILRSYRIFFFKMNISQFSRLTSTVTFIICLPVLYIIPLSGVTSAKSLPTATRIC